MSGYRSIPGVAVIGLGHKARHGKDSAARILIETFGSKVQRFSFADDLYAVCRIVHGMRGKDAPLLQRIGLEYRQRDPDTWVRSVYSKILEARPALAVITDVRFPNEFELVRALGGVCWKITRRLEDGSVFVDPSRPADHPSETALDGAAWDCEIENPDGRPDLFRGRVLSAYMAAPLRIEAELEAIEAGPCACVPARKMGLHC
jgi:hypothetical protein